MKRKDIETAIKNKQTVWILNLWNEPEPCSVTKIKEVFGEENAILMNEELNNEPFSFRSLFASEKQALHFAEFGNVERLDKMPVPPTWEEFCKKFYYYTMKISDHTLDLLANNGNTVLKIWYKGICVFNETLNEENYKLALKKIVKIFKGEE